MCEHCNKADLVNVDLAERGVLWGKARFLGLAEMKTVLDWNSPGGLKQSFIPNKLPTLIKPKIANTWITVKFRKHSHLAALMAQG